jgi:cytochrome c556
MSTSRPVIAVLLTMLLPACDGPSPPNAQPAPSASNATRGTLTPKISINAVMVALVDHAAHNLWDSEGDGRQPKSDADWQRLNEHAAQIVAARAAITVGGTGPTDGVWMQSPSWHTYADRMADAGLAALTAINNKNIDALIAANGQLVESCESCHKEFKPALPTEGIVHRQAP